MTNTEELQLTIWGNEDPEFELWRKRINGESESDMIKIDRFAKNTKDQIENITVKVNKLDEDLFIPTTEEAIEGVINSGYMTPFLVNQAIKHSGSVGSIRLKHVVKSLYTTEDKQKNLDIPMSQYNPEVHLFELRVGGVPFFHERYTVQGNTVILNENEVGLPIGKRVDFVFYYLEVSDLATQNENTKIHSKKIQALEEENLCLGQMITDLELMIFEMKAQE